MDVTGNQTWCTTCCSETMLAPLQPSMANLLPLMHTHFLEQCHWRFVITGAHCNCDWAWNPRMIWMTLMHCIVVVSFIKLSLGLWGTRQWAPSICATVEGSCTWVLRLSSVVCCWLMSGAKAYAQVHYVEEHMSVMSTPGCDMLVCNLLLHHASWQCTVQLDSAQCYIIVHHASDPTNLAEVSCSPSCSTTNNTMQAKPELRHCIQFIRSFVQAFSYSLISSFACQAACPYLH